MNNTASKMPIKEIRSVIDCLRWNTSDLTGGTSEEFKRMNIPAMLQAPLAKVEALEIPVRFARDIEDRATAINSAHAVIRRWYARQAA